MRERRMQANNNTFRSLYEQITVPRRRPAVYQDMFSLKIYLSRLPGRTL
jgi:hypothetical protein